MTTDVGFQKRTAESREADELQRRLHREATRQLKRSIRTLTRLSARYAGADDDEQTRGWVSHSGSADDDLYSSLETLRERSRELVRNDGLARAAIDVFVSNVIGRGLRPQSTLRADRLGLSPETAREVQQSIEDQFEDWCKVSDSRNRLDFYGMQDLVFRSILTDGDVFSRPVMVFDEPWRKHELAIEIYEAERVATPFDREGSGRIRFGIELGDRGQPIACHVRKAHPGDRYRMADSLQFDRVPIRTPSGTPQILHHFRPLRPDQSRGIPILSTVLRDLNDRRDYLEAERVAARAAACIALIFTTPNARPAEAVNAVKQGNRIIEDLIPGTIQYAAPGEEVESFDPKRPNSAFDPFLRTIERTIGAGIGLSYDSLTRDTSKSNFSNARTAIIADRRLFRVLQRWFTDSFCRPYWELFVQELVLKDKLPIPVRLDQFDAMHSEWTRADFIPDGWEWLEPLKDIQATTLAIEAGLESRTRASRMRGVQFEEIVRDREREAELLGIDPNRTTENAPLIEDDDDDDAEADDSGEDSREGAAAGSRDAD